MAAVAAAGGKTKGVSSMIIFGGILLFSTISIDFDGVFPKDSACDIVL